MRDIGKNASDEAGPLLTQQELEALVANMETDENMKKMAEKLFEEWKQLPENQQGTPDLSFATFAEKLKGRKDQ